MIPDKAAKGVQLDPADFRLPEKNLRNPVKQSPVLSQDFHIAILIFLKGNQAVMFGNIIQKIVFLFLHRSGTSLMLFSSF